MIDAFFHSTVEMRMMKLQQLIFAIIACFLVLSSFVIVMADSSDDFKDLHENCAAWVG